MSAALARSRPQQRNSYAPSGVPECCVFSASVHSGVFRGGLYARNTEGRKEGQGLTAIGLPQLGLRRGQLVSVGVGDEISVAIHVE